MMQIAGRFYCRRTVLVAGAAAGGIASSPALAQMLLTPPQTSGPFYPLELPLDSNNDLTVVDGAPRPALGDVIHIGGRIFSSDGSAIPGARVELWQANAVGRYHHPFDSSSRDVDEGFQGFGQTLTTEDGDYRFKTVLPGLYPGRARHVHFAVYAPDGRELVTQMYFDGEVGNDKDGLLNRIADPAQRASVIVAFTPTPDEPDSTTGRFDMVLS